MVLTLTCHNEESKTIRFLSAGFSIGWRDVVPTFYYLHHLTFDSSFVLSIEMKTVAAFFFLTILCWLAATGSADQYHPARGSPIRSKALKPPQKEGKDYWNNLAQQLLKDELKKEMYNTTAKNVILFLGDGMSITTVTAARIYKGQKAGFSGEEQQLSFDKFPFTALSRTYCANSQVADSACSATAYLSGVKTDIDTLGLTEDVVYQDCSTQNNPDNRLDSIFTWAQSAEMATGIVTTTRITHATPAGAYAHVANRDWEDDTYVKADGQDPETCDDIAEQLVYNPTAQKFDVILGGGRSYFLPKSVNDSEKGTGRRDDGINLIEQWKKIHADGTYVYLRDQLMNQSGINNGPLLGLFSPGHLEYFTESADAQNPTLEEMTKVAISRLQKNDKGFVLLVEGGRIDHAHHDGRAKMALEEALQFDLAIQAALDMTKRSETLIIVTADHSHTFSINGYPVRGNDLFGLAQNSYTPLDGKPYTTLAYANGPGWVNAFVDGTRLDLTTVDTTADDFLQPALVPMDSETHGGDDVAIYAIGPQAHMFQGVYEQHYIAHVIGYAAKIGPGLHFSSASAIFPSVITMLIALITLLYRSA